MKFSKLFCCFIAIFLTVSLVSGCEVLSEIFVKTEYEFLRDVSEIQSIEIAIMGNIEETDDPVFNFVYKIEDKDAFLRDFTAVHCTRHFMDPTSVDEGDPVVKITYSDGDYEIIGADGQSNRKDGIYECYAGKYDFDTLQFEILLRKYVGNAPIPVEYVFLADSAKISEIQIVKLGVSTSGNWAREEQMIIGEVRNIPEFFEAFSKIDCFLILSDPIMVQDHSVAIKILYDGGNYELITAIGQSKYYNSGRSAGGCYYLDKVQFSNFIEMYIE